MSTLATLTSMKVNCSSHKIIKHHNNIHIKRWTGLENGKENGTENGLVEDLTVICLLK